jgi:long-chain fatty acid transport protein
MQIHSNLNPIPKYMITRALALTLVFAAFSMLFSQNGTRLIGYDAKTIGRGGVSTGLFDSPTLMMTNPAGISFLNGNMLEADFSMMVPKIKFQNSLNDAQGTTNYYPLPSFGLIYTPKKSKITLGLGFYTNGGMGSELGLYHELSQDKQEYYSKFAVMQGGPSFSYKFNKKFSAGFSAHVYYSMMDFRMPYSLSPNELKGVVNPQTGMTFGQLFSAPQSQGGLGYDEVTAYSDMSGLSAFGFGGKLGLAYKVNEKFSLGLSYTLPVSLDYIEGTANMDMSLQMNDAFGRVVTGYMTNYPGLTQEQATDSATNAFTMMGIDLSQGAAATYTLENKMSLPQSFAFGLSFSPNKKLRMGLDFEWLNWKKAFEKMELILNGGANPNINRMMGNEGSFSLDFPLEWKDSYIIHLGGEYDFAKFFTFRAGYTYGTNPVPEETVFPVFPAIVENHIMAGATLNVSKKVAVNLAYEMALNKKLTASDPSKIANEYDGSISELQTMLFHLSLTWKY